MWGLGWWLGVPQMVETGHYHGPVAWLLMIALMVSAGYIIIGAPIHLYRGWKR